MATDKYRDPVIEKILDLLKEANIKGIKKYHNGDRLIGPKREMPYLSIAKSNTKVSPASNLEDQHIIQMTLTVVYDWTKDLNQSSELVAGANGLYELMEGRDPVTYQLREDSVLGVLRKNETLGNKAWIAVGDGEVAEVQYGLGVNRRGPGIFSTEAIIKFNVTLHLPKLPLLN